MLLPMSKDSSYLVKSKTLENKQFSKIFVRLELLLIEFVHLIYEQKCCMIFAYWFWRFLIDRKKILNSEDFKSNNTEKHSFQKLIMLFGFIGSQFRFGYVNLHKTDVIRMQPQATMTSVWINGTLIEATVNNSGLFPWFSCTNRFEPEEYELHAAYFCSVDRIENIPLLIGFQLRP